MAKYNDRTNDELDEVHTYDHNDEFIEERTESRTNWLVPLLVIPVFFVLGWLANDFARTNPAGQDVQQQFGVGGGPIETVVSPSPMTIPPTQENMDVSPSPIPLREGLEGMDTIE